MGTNSFGRIPRNHTGHGDKRSSKPTQKYDDAQICRFATLADAYFSQVTKLCGPEPLTKHFVLAVVTIQVLCAVYLHNTPIFSLKYVLAAYVIGATANQNLFLAIHEISHNLAFKDPLANRLFAVFANLPIGVPYSAAFRVSISMAHTKSLEIESNNAPALSSDPP